MTRKNKKSSKSILFVKNSKSKSYKHKKKGRLGKNCIYFNEEKKTCKNMLNFKSYNIFCKSNGCPYYKEKETNKEDYLPLPFQSGTHECTNEYIAVSKNIGTPCHVGYMKSNEPRRHKARCIYYNKESKKCRHYLYKCIGSSKCEKYKESILQ